jgi:hypothetical protein
MSTTESTQSENTASLTLLSLKNAANIINVASQRNAFKIEELELVGKTYNELTNFVRLTEEQNKPAVGDSAAVNSAADETTSSATVNSEEVALVDDSVNNTSDVNVV